MNPSIIVGSVAFLCGFLVASMLQGSSTPKVEPLPVPTCQESELQELKLANYGLQRQVDGLQQSLDTEKNKCDIVARLDQEKRDREAKQQNQREAAEQQARAVSQAKDQLLSLVRSGPLFQSQWTKILVGKSKSEVIALIGEPTRVRKPSSSATALYEMWLYAGKVKLEERPGETRDLTVIFDAGGQVATVSSQA